MRNSDVTDEWNHFHGTAEGNSWIVASFFPFISAMLHYRAERITANIFFESFGEKNAANRGECSITAYAQHILFSVLLRIFDGKICRHILASRVGQLRAAHCVLKKAIVFVLCACAGVFASSQLMCSSHACCASCGHVCIGIFLCSFGLVANWSI